MISPLLLLGVGGGAVVTLVYAAVALFRYRRKPDLADAVNIFGTTAGAVGGLRTIVGCISGDYGQLVKARSTLQQQSLPLVDDSMWMLQAEDVVFILIGSGALIWVSILGLSRVFYSIHQLPKIPPRPPAD